MAYAAEGADLVLADLNAEALAEVQKVVEAKGRRAISIEADLGDVEAIDAHERTRAEDAVATLIPAKMGTVQKWLADLAQNAGA